MSEIPGYYSQDAVDAQYEQMIKELGILGEEIENLKTENKRLKEHWIKLNKLIDGNKYTIIKNDDRRQRFDKRVFQINR